MIFMTKTTINDVHKVIKKWLFIGDTTIIDVILSTYISNKKKGTAIWLFIIDQSGETKTELLRPLYNRVDVELISDINTKGFVSGNANANDLFSRLQGESTVIVIPDLATLSSKRKDEKNEIWALFRDLYDGILSRQTGVGSKQCLDAHVTMIGAATPRFRSQYIINQQLGTRELLYTPNQRSEYLEKKLEKVRENNDYEDPMRKEIKKVISNFLKEKMKLKSFKIGDNFNIFLNKQVMRLRIIRASADVDYRTGAIIGEINIETPTRAKKQLMRLYEGLMNLDDNYDVKRAAKIIERVVDSSGNQLRMKIMNIFDADRIGCYRIVDIANKIRSSKHTVKLELEILWQLKWLEKDVREKRIGGYIYQGKDGIEYERGGYLKDIPYYKRGKNV